MEPQSEQAKDISSQAHNVQEHSFGVHLVALTLNKMGDALLDVKLVLPWLLTAIGAPAILIAWLVPLRESLALLPQFFIAEKVQRFAIRKYLWCIGCVMQGVCVIAMAITPWLFAANLAGIAILILLALFSLSRCLCSIVIKDVQGKTIDKQRRGRVSGLATSLAGAAAILFALALLFGWLSSHSLIAISALLVVAGLCWIIAGLVYAQLREFPSDHFYSTTKKESQWLLYKSMLKQKQVWQFLLVRGLLISTALVAPFYVLLANRYSEGNISVLGFLLLLAGLANLSSGWFWGKLSDLSSRMVLSLAGMLCFLLAVIVNLAIYFNWPLAESYLWYGAILFALYIGHAGVRLGRTTYLLDMSKEHNRTQLVALSNTIIGVILLLVGSAISVFNANNVEMTVLFLGACSLLAGLLAYRLPEVTQI